MQKLIIISFIVSIILISSCKFSGQNSSYTQCITNKSAMENEIIRGNVIVMFNEGLTKIDAEKLIKSYNLEILDWYPPDFTYAKIKVLGGNREDYIHLFESHSRIGKVKIVNDSNDELLIYFYIPDFKNLKPREVESILREFDGVELVHDEIYDKFMKIDWAVVKVPEGSEVEWICKLKQEKIIEDAEFNGVTSISY